MMGNVVRRALGDATISLVALVILLVVLASVDDRVREQVSAVLGTTHGSSQLAGASQEVSSLVAVVFDAVKYQSVSHAPMVIFALVATVLVVFMVRT
jgi:hypothetical protein